MSIVCLKKVLPFSNKGFIMKLLITCSLDRRMLMSFDIYLKQIRKNRKLSQRALADMIGVSNTEISRLESGERQKPSPLIIKKISEALQIPLENMMSEAGYMNTSENLSGLEFENIFKEIMKNYLLKNGWSISEAEQDFDLIASRDDIRWVIEYKYFKEDMPNNKFYTSLVFQSLYSFLGKVCLDTNLSKCSIVVNSQTAFDIISNCTPQLLKIDVSLILLDFDKKCLSQEKYLLQN